MSATKFLSLAGALFALNVLLMGCDGSSPDAPRTAAVKGPVFQFSTARPPDGTIAGADWCQASFEENVVVNAEKINTNRRYFFLQPGVTWVAAGRDNARANFLLRALPDGNVEVFTGANFPKCLSRVEYLTPIEGDFSRFRYYNKTNIDFTFDVQTDQGYPKITLEFRPGTFYAVNVLRCSTCGLN